MTKRRTARRKKRHTADPKNEKHLGVLRDGKTLEAHYRGLLETVPDAIVMVNDRGQIVLVNGQAERMFGYKREELLDRPIEILLPERFRGGHVGHRTQNFSEPKTRAMGAGLQLYASRKDGNEFPVEISLSPLRTAEGTFTMSAIRDISERKRLEEQLQTKNKELEEQNRLVQQANRLKSEFLANMSHELRTPLNGIIGFAEIMHDGKVGPISDQHKEFTGDILASGRHLLQLINDILDLSKIESGKWDFSPQSIDPATVVAEVRDIVRTLAAKKRISLNIEIDPSLSGIVADPRSLKQILYNYLSNALKFTPDEGMVTLRVKPEDADHFRIEVEDNGIGIKPEDTERLFVEFQQLDASSAKKYPGTGLGLALTKRIVEAQGGRVGVESASEKGSTFYAVLPRVFRNFEEGGKEIISAPSSPEAPLILVVEDSARDRDWITGTLTHAGYAVQTAATGTEALMRCRERRFDAITLDIILPDMSGRAVLEKLREGGLNQETPVVVVTVVAQKGVVAGFQVADIISKPASEGDIVRALKQCGVASDNPRPILVVDDDESSLKLADKTLRGLGYRPLCRQDAASALKAASEEQPAAVVLDLIMPEINGFEFLKRFRKTSAGRQTPVIVWTGKDLTESERAELRAAGSAITKKDDEGTELIQEINNCLVHPSATARSGVRAIGNEKSE